MSTDLSEKRFTESAQQGAFSWLFEGFRTRMRDTAKFVRMEAAWRTWPAIHRVAKSMQESMTTPADIEGERQEWIHAFAQRCAEAYPTEEWLGDMNDPDRRREVALGLGLTSGFDDPDAEFSLDEVLEVYRSQYAKAPEAAISPDMT